MMDKKEIKRTLMAYAESGMKKNTAAKKLFLSGTGFEYRLRQIKRITGKNPKNFFELAELLENINNSSTVKSVPLPLHRGG